MSNNRLKSPLNMQVELTTACNNLCLHCYNYQKQDKTPDTTMSPDNLHKVLDEIKDAEIFSVGVTGGEPFLHPKLVKQAVEYCSENDISCSVNTNLTTVNEKMIDAIDTRKFNILTSLASYDETMHDAMMGRAGAYKRTLSGIDVLKYEGIDFSINMVVTKENAEQVYQTGLLAHRLGATAFCATKTSPPLGCIDYSAVQPTANQVLKSLDDLILVNQDTGIKTDILECYPHCFLSGSKDYEKFTNHSCTAGISSSTVRPDGDMRPCSHSDRIYGSVLQEDITTIFARMGEWQRGDLLPDICKRCGHAKQCFGGCRCEAEYATGSITGCDPLTSKEPIDIKPTFNEIIDNQITEKNIVSVNRSVRFRGETFGTILWKAGVAMAVDDEAGGLLKDLKKKSMSVREIAEIYHVGISEVIPVLGAVYNKKMLTKV
jgi:radical SAM protein with 4Fe4S-binding SPASM domain